MSELHPSTSAVGLHMDELVENPAAARQMESRSQQVQTKGASRQLHEEKKETDADAITEEAMHLDL